MKKSEHKKSTPEYRYVGIDVSSATLSVAWEGAGGAQAQVEVKNTSEGHQEVLQRVKPSQGAPVRAVVEATSVYMLDVAIALHDAGVSVMVVNPFQARKFAEAQHRRSKTDAVDAQLLKEYGSRMEWKAWEPPSAPVMALRQMARRIKQVVALRVAEENRLHVANTTATTTPEILEDLEATIAHFREREAALSAHALTLIRQSDELNAAYQHVTSVRGIADRTAVVLLGELLVLPKEMTGKQVVAYAGLDPRHRQSGAVALPVHISRVGNAQIRAALYLPALCASQHDPVAKAFVDRLHANGKARKSAIVALMRKMLVLLWALIQTKSMYDADRWAGLKKVA